MKKSILIAVCFIGAAVLFTAAHGAVTPAVPALLQKADWKKAKGQTWPGMFEGKTYWYKIGKMAKLSWSTDGKKWADVESGSWADKDGKWLKIHEGKLVWSADGKEWAEVPEWKWQGSDGKWYKFDEKWTLWVNA